MFKPNLSYPFPKEKFSTPWLFLEQDNKRYPFPLPSEELYPEYAWPKSLCKHAPECPIDDNDNFQDLDPVSTCEHALREGCPLYLTQFSEYEEFGECTKIPIFEVGQIESQDYTEQDLDQIIENFSRLQKTHRPPLVVLGHGEDQELLKKSGLPAAGWISKVWRQGKMLYADLKDVPQKVVKAVKLKAYQFPSVEIYRNFIHDGKNLGNVLRRVALLGADIPRIKSLDDIVARYEEPYEWKCEEGEFGPMCLPVMQSDSFGEDNSETVWLGGNHMSKNVKQETVPIKDVTGKFKVGEAILCDGKEVGKLEEMAEESLVVTITAKDGKLEGEITGKDSEATATIGEVTIDEPEIHNEQEFELDIHEAEGIFEDGEVFALKDTDISGVVKNAEASKLIVLVTPDMMDELKKNGQVIVGKNSKAIAKTGTEPTGQYPYPEKKGDPNSGGDKVDLKQLQEKVADLTSELSNLTQKNKELTTLSEKQGSLIQQVEKERSQEKRDAHFERVQMWAEDLKEKGLAPAMVDEGGLMNFAHAMDWQKPVQFAEGAEAKTPWEAFSELMKTMVDFHSENKLFVPLQKLDQTSDTSEIIPEEIDAEGLELHKRIEKYAEEKKCTYDEAFKAVYSDAKDE